MEKITNKPWGNEELLFQGHGYAVKKICILPNQQTSMHFHNIKHETIMVNKGILLVYLDDRIHPPKSLELNAGDSLAINPLQIHQMYAGAEPVVYFEAQTDHLEDVVRIQDNYGRAVQR